MKFRNAALVGRWFRSLLVTTAVVLSRVAHVVTFVLPFPLPRKHRSLAKHDQLKSPFLAPTFQVTRAADRGDLVPDSIMSRGMAEDEPVWDPIAQIYVGGKVPEHAAVAAAMSQGTLRIFGYGSLCWNPGTGVLAHPTITQGFGRVRGYRRCWAQRSTDHRGTPSFPGIVCTLLTAAEYRTMVKAPADATKDSDDWFTEGVIYTVPPELVQDCLEELDYREKGVSPWLLNLSLKI
jgi:ChaC-like protein